MFNICHNFRNSVWECLYFYPEPQKLLQLKPQDLKEVRCKKVSLFLLCPHCTQRCVHTTQVLGPWYRTQSSCPRTPLLGLAWFLGSVPSILLSPGSAQRPQHSCPPHQQDSPANALEIRSFFHSQGWSYSSGGLSSSSGRRDSLSQGVPSPSGLTPSSSGS